MDKIVLRGMAKWPDVPAVYGWLSLDRRGNWQIKGERVANAGINAFISRNYGHDNDGRWYFQNGPQRVFVALDYTPFVYRIIHAAGAQPALECHTGKPVAMISYAGLDEAGTLLLHTEHGIGLVHDRDLDRVFPRLTDINGNPLDDKALTETMERLQQQHQAPLWLKFRDDRVKVEPIRSGDVPARFGFVTCPTQPAGEKDGG